MDYFSGLSFSLGGAESAYVKTHRHTPMYYGVQYNNAGSFFLRVSKGAELRLDGPFAFITHPGAFFEYGSVDRRPRDHNYVCFYGPRVQKYIESGLLPVSAESQAVKISHPKKFHSRMLELISAINVESVSPDRMTLALEDILLQLHEQSSRRPGLSGWRGPLLSGLLERIDENPGAEWDFNREAELMGASHAHFRRFFRQAAGVSPRQYLIQRRLRSAAEMLVTGSDPVALIAEKTGFESGFYLSRMFKRKYAVSPLAYRREFSGV
jgi:AraC-like DNA-binding protein